MTTLPDRPAALAEMLSISTPYAAAILKGDRPWTRALAIAAYRQTGIKVGPIEGASDDEIAVLARFEPARPTDTSRAAA